MVQTFDNATFLLIRSTIRTALICSLLVFGHVLLTTLAVAPRELIDAHPMLPTTAKHLSALTFLTLLWQVFVLIEISDCLVPGWHPAAVAALRVGARSSSDPRSPRSSFQLEGGDVEKCADSLACVRVVAVDEECEAAQGKLSEDAEDAEDRPIVVFGMAGMEGVVGFFAMVCWGYFLEDAITLFQIFSPSIATELCILPITFALAGLSLVLLNTQLFFHVLCGIENGNVAGRWWSSRTGCWGSRIMLRDSEAEEGCA